MKVTFTAMSTAQPASENHAPQMVLSISLYQKDRLNYMPIIISAAITIGTTLSPTLYPAGIISSSKGM